MREGGHFLIQGRNLVVPFISQCYNESDGFSLSPLFPFVRPPQTLRQGEDDDEEGESGGRAGRACCAWRHDRNDTARFRLE